MRVLIADDDPVSRTLLQRLLQRAHYDVLAVSDGLEAWEALQREDAPRLVVLDWMMPGLDGIGVIERLRATPRNSYTYVLLLTALSEKDEVKKGLSAGADDYLTKPCDAGELEARLQVGRRILELEDRLVASYQEARFQADHDGLTKLYNRAVILSTLSRELARGTREAHDTSILMMDIDHFKAVNDAFGHAAGDEVLRAVAQTLQVSVRNYDMVGRYGGEEFIVLAPNCRFAQGVRLAERIRTAVAGASISHRGTRIPISVSIGVACGRGQSADAMLCVADAALYRAKRNGRDRVEAAQCGPEALAEGQPADHAAMAVQDEATSG